MEITLNLTHKVLINQQSEMYPVLQKSENNHPKHTDLHHHHHNRDKFYNETLNFSPECCHSPNFRCEKHRFSFDMHKQQNNYLLTDKCR